MDSIPVLCTSKTYHFNNAFVYFVINNDDDFITRLGTLLIIFTNTIIDLNQMDERYFTDNVMCNAPNCQLFDDSCTMTLDIVTLDIVTLYSASLLVRPYVGSSVQDLDNQL